MKKVRKNCLLMAAVLTLALAMLCGCGNGEASGANSDSAVNTVTEGKLIMATNAYFPP